MNEENIIGRPECNVRSRVINSVGVKTSHVLNISIPVLNDSKFKAYYVRNLEIKASSIMGYFEIIC